jgi:hypothetical protein
VERVRERRANAREENELIHGERRLAAAALRRLAGDADDVAEVDVDLAGTRGRTEELDAAGAVDEVEEDELPMSRRATPPGEAPGVGGLRPILERVGPARTAAISSRRKRFEASSRPLDHSPGVRAVLRRAPSRTRLEAGLRGEVVLCCLSAGRSAHRRARRRDAGASSAPPILAPRGSLTPMPAVPVRAAAASRSASTARP